MGISPSFYRSNNPEWDQDNSLCPWKIREMDLSNELIVSFNKHLLSAYFTPGFGLQGIEFTEINKTCLYLPRDPGIYLIPAFSFCIAR